MLIRRRLYGAVLAAGLAMSVMAVGQSASAKSDKVALCHYDADSDSYKLISVGGNGNAVDAHLNHGDGLPGGPVPQMAGYTFGDDCVPVEPPGLSDQARAELSAAGVDKYLGEFSPAVTEPLSEGWLKHSFDTDGGNGPIGVAGTPFSAFTQTNDTDKVLVFLQGGGACWQDFYFCNILCQDQEPPLPSSGIWAESFDDGSGSILNPLADWSVVYVPYCDGSVFTGDNDVVDPNFPFGPVRFHRGHRNLSAAMDLAADQFPDADHVMVAGSSAGGVGAASFAPLLARFVFGNSTELIVLNDAGPVTANLDEVAAVQARADDWQFGQFYPASCVSCDALGQGIELIEWRLDNDSAVRDGYYSTDGDATIRFFLNVPTQAAYRALIVTEHDALHDSHPDRYKVFITSGTTTHTALQGPLFYLEDADGVPLHEWTADFLTSGPSWQHLIEDFVPAP